jgi:2-polyprenyl-3-methyl-5-hydroxy-6-metoxy-1,4-benzoquinol methylase
MNIKSNTNQPHVTLCKVCEKPQAKTWLIAKGFRVGKCSQCGFAQVLDVPSAASLSQLYETLHTKHIKYRSSQSAQIENILRLKFLQQHIPKGGRVLDAGCATGDFLIEAAEVFEVYGFDISSAAIAHAKTRLPGLSDRLTSWRLEDRRPSYKEFDAVCLWDVIEHVTEPAVVIQKMMDYVKPGGYLLISTPDFGSFTAKLMRSYWAFMIPPYHLGYFSKQSFEHIFTNRVPGKIVSYETRGKTVDLAFFFYKLNQMSSWLVPEFILNRMAKSRLGRLKLYIPSNDIAYLAVRKPYEHPSLIEKKD